MIEKHINQPSRKMDMTGPIIDINWEYLLQTRAEVIQNNDDMPAYLVVPEVTDLIESEFNTNRRLAFEMMYILGCRVSELLLLTPRHFVFNEHTCYANVPTLKRRANQSKRKRKRLNDIDSLGKYPLRQVPITDEKFIARLKSHVITKRIPENRRFFAVTRRTVNRWVDEAVQKFNAQEKKYKYSPLLVHCTPHTFRHSFAVNAVLHYTPLKILQAWLGHSHISSTEVYTKVLFSDSFDFAKRIVWRQNFIPY